MLNDIAPNFLHEGVHKEVQCGGAGSRFVVAHAENAERRLAPIHLVTPWWDKVIAHRGMPRPIEHHGLRVGDETIRDEFIRELHAALHRGHLQH